MAKKKKIILAVAVLAVLAIAALGIWFIFSPKGQPGGKVIAIEVVYADQSSKLFAFETEAEFLRGALEEQGLVEGTESPYGLFITSVDGVQADEAKQEWWCITKRGEAVTTGVDTTPLANGDQFELTLTTGY